MHYVCEKQTRFLFFIWENYTNVITSRFGGFEESSQCDLLKNFIARLFNAIDIAVIDSGDAILTVEFTDKSNRFAILAFLPLENGNKSNGKQSVRVYKCS